MSNLIKIRDMATRFGVSSRTLRYYEQVGILKSVRLNESSYRFYDEEAALRLEQILILRKMQLPIKDIIEIFKSEDIVVTINAFSKKMKQLDDDISTLTQLREIVDSFLNSLKEHGFKNANGLALLYEETMSRVDLQKKSNREEVKVEEINRISDKIGKINDVRIMELPSMEVVSSTYEECTPFDERLIEFVNWTKDKKIYCKPGMREGFMFNSKDKNGYELIMRIKDDFNDTANYEVKMFTGGLYAVTTANMEEIVDKYNQLTSWINESENYELDPNRDTLGEIITPEEISKKFNIEQQDIFIPISII